MLHLVFSVFLVSGIIDGSLSAYYDVGGKYLLSKASRLSRGKADQFCRGQNYRLVDFDSQAKFNEIQEWVQINFIDVMKKGGHFWTAMTALPHAGESQFPTLSDGTSSTYNKWTSKARLRLPVGNKKKYVLAQFNAGKQTYNGIWNAPDGFRGKALCEANKVDGEWSDWSACSVDCGGGKRTRVCDNPAPAHGGNPCDGIEEEDCNVHACPINGGFSAWGEWSGCSKNCGGGSKSRSRACDSPAPQHGGADCVGSHQESAPCNTHVCAPSTIHSGWTSSGDDQRVSVSCPSGMIALSCECVNSDCDGAQFYGDTCTVINRSGTGKSQAKLTCLPTDNTVGVTNVVNEDYKRFAAGVLCPPSHEMTGCSIFDPWSQENGRDTYGRASVVNSAGTEICKATHCGNQGCQVQARCISNAGNSSPLVLPKVLFSAWTSTGDDQKASVSCPSGMIALSCECTNPQCDGAYFTGDTTCTVVNRGGQPRSTGSGKSQARLTCLDVSTQAMTNVQNEYINSKFTNPAAGVTCPDSYTMSDCALFNPWSQESGRWTWGRGTVVDSAGRKVCKAAADSGCGSRGCQLQARCILY